MGGLKTVSDDDFDFDNIGSRSYIAVEESEVRDIKNWPSFSRGLRMLQKEKDYIPSCPEQWFRFDTWTTREALLLLAGIEPVHADIDWYYLQTCETVRNVQKVQILDGQIFGLEGLVSPSVLDFHLSFGRMGLKKTTEELYNRLDKRDANIIERCFRTPEGDLSLSQNAEEYIEVRICDRAYDWAEVRLNKLYDMWVSRIDAEAEDELNLNTRYSVEYYINWVRNKNRQEEVPWWTDAIKKGLVAPDNEKVASQVVEVQSTSFDFLNTSHEHFSLKLKAAVDAWEAVSNIAQLKTSPKTAIREWLRVNAEEYGLIKKDASLNETAIEEIAKVAHWNQMGGAPKISE